MANWWALSPCVLVYSDGIHYLCKGHIMRNLFLGILISIIVFSMWRTFAGIPDTYLARAGFGALQGAIAVGLIVYAIVNNRND